VCITVQFEQKDPESIFICMQLYFLQDEQRGSCDIQRKNTSLYVLRSNLIGFQRPNLLDFKVLLKKATLD